MVSTYCEKLLVIRNSKDNSDNQGHRSRGVCGGATPQTFGDLGGKLSINDFRRQMNA